MGKLIPRFKELLDEIEQQEGRKLKQADIVRYLQKEFGYGRSTVSAWFVGDNEIPFSAAWELSKYLNRSMHEFYREEEE